MLDYLTKLPFSLSANIDRGPALGHVKDQSSCLGRIYNSMSSSAGAIAPTHLSMTHLDRLEAESIHIIREVAAEFDNPVMMYSVGKDSAVMLHLARKAFYPGRIPFPLLHVDTDWKFKEMITYLFS